MGLNGSSAIDEGTKVVHGHRCETLSVRSKDLASDLILADICYRARKRYEVLRVCEDQRKYSADPRRTHCGSVEGSRNSARSRRLGRLVRQTISEAVCADTVQDRSSEKPD